jgi:hypothetical protein
MKWVALLLVAVVGLGFAADRAFSPDHPYDDCSGAFTPGGLVDERDPGAATADAAVAGFLENADHWTSESSRTYVDVVTFTTYDADERPLVVVEAEHRMPKGWFVGRTTTCD